MDRKSFLSGLAKESGGKLLLVVLDGLGGLPGEEGLTELEAARTPNLDALAKEGVCGLADPVAPGVTPGSGPGHLGLFGYDPMAHNIGRGVLSALGVGFPLEHGDLAARANFCTVDEAGNVVDRRAGRIPTETAVKLCARLDGMRIGDVEVFVRAEKEHRAAVVFRGEDLCPAISDTDPQATGVPPKEPAPLDPRAQRSASIVAEFLSRVKETLKDEHPANMMLLRGFDTAEEFPRMPDLYKMRCAAIATYPMYRGIARLCGMELLDSGETIEEEVACLERNWPDYDYFFLHVKKTDSYGEDGNREAKIKVIESVDALVPRIRALKPAALAVTADHSTPCAMKMHSWHPVPVLLWGANVRPDGVESFGERACAQGGLGRIRLEELLGLMLAHAGRLEKYGA